MTQTHQQVADSIVDHFRAGLSESARQHIDSEHFDGSGSLLTLLVKFCSEIPG